MKIIHVSCTAPPEIGGIGRSALREVAGLRALGEDAVLVAPEIDTREGERSFVRRLRPLWRFGNASSLSGLADVLGKADVIHLHYPYYGTAEGLLMSYRHLPPIIVTFHMDATAGGWKGFLFRLQRWLVQPWILPAARRILVSSFDYAKHSSIKGIFRVHPERVEELPFGVDTDVFSPGPDRRERFMIPAESRVVLFVGGLDRAHAFKGIHELLTAFSKLDPADHLLLVGEGDLRESYETRARELGIANRVHFLGKIDQETLVDAYRTADVFAFPSTSAAEAFGLVALEAQACGVPVVASDLPGVRTVVKRDETGKLVVPGDVEQLAGALRDLLHDPQECERMAKNARAHAEQYSWERHVERLREIYRHVCALRS
jgi:glycosyltransferase involved in cell wall biosynthesis